MNLTPNGQIAKGIRDRRELRALIASGDAKRLRLEAGLTLREVGNAVGADGAAVYRWERGERYPSPENAARYLRLLRTLASAVQA